MTFLIALLLFAIKGGNGDRYWLCAKDCGCFCNISRTSSSSPTESFLPCSICVTDGLCCDEITTSSPQRKTRYIVPSIMLTHSIIPIESITSSNLPHATATQSAFNIGDNTSTIITISVTVVILSIILILIVIFVILSGVIIAKKSCPFIPDAIQRTFSYTTRPSVTNRKITETRTRDMEPTLQITFSVNKSSNERKQDLPIYITPNELDCTTDEVHMRKDGENVTGLFQPPLTTSDEHSYIDSEEDSFDESMHYV